MSKGSVMYGRLLQLVWRSKGIPSMKRSQSQYRSIQQMKHCWCLPLTLPWPPGLWSVIISHVVVRRTDFWPLINSFFDGIYKIIFEEVWKPYWTNKRLIRQYLRVPEAQNPNPPHHLIHTTHRYTHTHTHTNTEMEHTHIVRRKGNRRS